MNTRVVCPPPVWNSLAEEGNNDLLTKLHYAEANTPGFGTITVPPQGFSDNDITHNSVLDWLKEHNIHVFNTSLEITNLEYALHGEPPCEYSISIEPSLE